MGPRPSLLLVLVLCLGQTIHMQEGLLPKPSIRVEPEPVIRWGRPATIVCRGPAGAEIFRLERVGISDHRDKRNVFQRGSHWAEATFHTDAANEVTAGRYFCHYFKRPSWSEHSDILELTVTGAPTPDTRTKPPSTAERATSGASLEGTGLSPKDLYILVGVCAASVLCLLLLVLLLVLRQRRKTRGPPSSKGEEPRPQDRLSPTADLTESPADVATTVDPLPEENGDLHSPSPAAQDPPEVTYAQLDQRALTRRAAPAASPQPTEPTPESSTQDLDFGDPYSTCRRFTNQMAPPATNQLPEAHL
ncbi:leukocyte-associated immunoglobulin-like receptor 1 isoform 2-T2 [Glossophaga mutica]